MCSVGGVYRTKNWKRTFVERPRCAEFSTAALLAIDTHDICLELNCWDGTVANQTKLAVILPADVVGSTGLVRRDEHLAHERIRDAFGRFAKTISNHGGRTHEVRGDALVAEFDRASDGATAALAFPGENQMYNGGLDNDIHAVCRVGIA